MNRSLAAVLAVLLSTGMVSVVHATPTISGVSPSHGPTAGGVLLTISGAQFSAAGNNAFVGGNVCQVTTETPEQIECLLPEGSGAQRPVRVTDAAGGASLPYPFSYDPPAVASVTPANGATLGGITITLTGENFGPNGGARSVKVGATDCPLDAVGASHTELRCTLPPGEGHDLAVAATVDGQGSSATAAFSYDPPVLTGVTPTSGPAGGGTIITITGENFGTRALVTVGDGACPVETQSHTELACTLPPQTTAPAEVRVTAGGQASNVLPFSYTVVASKCDAAKWKAAGKLAQCLAGAQAKVVKKGEAPNAKYVTPCTDKFDASCAKAETKLVGCTQIGSCDRIKDETRGWDGTIKGSIQ